jgi:hypothetical protein
VQREGDQRLAAARRGREHDVLAAEQLEDRLFLVRVELKAALRDPLDEAIEDRVR